MRRAPSNSARAVAFAVAFCALGIAAGCGQETFNLLPDSALAGAGASAGAGTSAGAVAVAGAATSGGGSGGSSAPAGNNAGLGGAGKAGAGGTGGRFGMPTAGGSDTFPCLGDGGCADEWPYCPTQCPFDEVCNPFTQRCTQVCNDNGDCADDKAHPRCFKEPGVCVTCIWENDCSNFPPLRRHCFLNECTQCSENWHCEDPYICVSGRCANPQH